MAQPMNVDDQERKEEEDFRTGPLSVLTTSVKTNSQVRGVVDDDGGSPHAYPLLRSSLPRDQHA